MNLEVVAFLICYDLYIIIISLFNLENTLQFQIWFAQPKRQCYQLPIFYPWYWVATFEESVGSGVLQAKKPPSDAEIE